MADPSLPADNDDGGSESDREWPDRYFWQIASEVGDRIEADRLRENSLQKRIVERLRSADTGHNTACY